MRCNALPGPAQPTPDLEMRSSPSAEPAGRREIVHTPACDRCAPDAGGDARAPRTRRANPRLGDALVPERGARRATGNPAYLSLRSLRPARCGRGRPRSQDPPSQPQTWRCARPRARSPQGDGRSCLSVAAEKRAPDAGGDARAPRTRPTNPRLGDALVPERGARRATGDRAYPSLRSVRPARCGRGRPRSQDPPSQSQTWRCARPRARSPQGDGKSCIPQPAIRASHKMRAGTPTLPGKDRPITSPRATYTPDAGGDAHAPREKLT
jgi:hypothetical protein